MGGWLRRIAIALLIGVVGLAVWGCAGTSMRDVQVYSPVPTEPFGKFLVVGIHENGRTRRLFENAFVAELDKQGVEGVQSYKSIYEERAITLPNVERAVRETGADAVITVRAVEVDIQPQNRPMQRDTLSFDLGSSDPNRRLLPHRDQVSLQINVFKSATREIVISATSRSVRPDSVEEIGREACQATVEALAREHLLRRR